MRFHRTLVWLLGALCSFGIAWLAGAIFHDSIRSVAWDETLQSYVARPGSLIRHRQEGWADTPIGLHGLETSYGPLINGESDARGPLFLLWGDSVVEGHQVAPEYKMMNVFNQSSGEQELRGIPVGFSGRSVADYVFDLTRYEALDPRIRGHVILVARMQDVLPGMHKPDMARFLSLPWRLEPGEQHISDAALRYGPLLQKYRLDMLQYLFSQVRDYDFRFAPGRAELMRKRAGIKRSRRATAAPGIEQGWEFLLTTLREKTEGFVVFVLMPNVPSVMDGEVRTWDYDAELKQHFAAECEKQGIAVVDTTSRFVELYEQTGQLPFGFFNWPSHPSHLNRNGHALVAQSLRAFFASEQGRRLYQN